MNDEIVDAPELRRTLTVDEVLAIVRVSRTTLYRMERDGAFPPATYVSANRRVWFVDEVAAWQRSLPNHRSVRRRRS